MALVLDGNGSMTVGNGDITGLSDGAIETTALGTGTVIQAKTAFSNTVITCTSGGASQAVVGTTFTPLYSNSMIYIMATSGQMRRTGFTTTTNNWGNFNVEIDGSSGTTFSGNVAHSSGLGAIAYPQSEQDGRYGQTINLTLNSWSGSKKVFANGSMGSTEGSFTFCFQNVGATMLILEIKQ